jgi:methionine-rich copper-binding protein CopC
MGKKFIIICLFLLPFSAFAHSPLVSLNPEKDAVLSEAPVEIKMVFKSPTRLIKLEIRKVRIGETDSLLSNLFGGKAGDHVSMAKVNLTKVSERHTIPLSQLDAGFYRVHYRAMGEDGHVIKEDFSFKVLND